MATEAMKPRHLALAGRSLAKVPRWFTKRSFYEDGDLPMLVWYGLMTSWKTQWKSAEIGTGIMIYYDNYGDFGRTLWIGKRLSTNSRRMQ